MNKILSLVLLALAGFKIVSSFSQKLEVGTMLGQEINIWLYRGIWLVFGIFAASSLVRRMRTKK